MTCLNKHGPKPPIFWTIFLKNCRFMRPPPSINRVNFTIGSLIIPSEITLPLKETYYAEIAELMKKTTGATHVKIFHHQVRNQEKANGNAQNLHTSVQGYANGIHRLL